MKWMMIVFLMISQIAFADVIITRDGRYVAVKPGDHVVVYNKQGKVLSESWFRANAYSLRDSQRFLAKLQRLTARNDKTSLGELVNYPLRVHRKGQSLEVKNAQQFAQHYRVIFTSKVVNSIRKQNPYELFANKQGVSIDKGVVWFKQCNDQQGLCISSINQ